MGSTTKKAYWPSEVFALNSSKDNTEGSHLGRLTSCTFCKFLYTVETDTLCAEAMAFRESILRREKVIL